MTMTQEAGKLFKELQGYSRSREFESLFKRVLDAANQAAQAAEEAETRKADLQKEITVLKAEAKKLSATRATKLKTIEDEMEAQRQEAVKSLDAEKVRLQGEIAEAVEAKERTWREATAEATKLSEVTAQTAKAISAEADRLDAARKSTDVALEKLTGDLDSATKAHAARITEMHDRESERMKILETTRKAKQAEVDALDAKLASLKETARKLAGG